MSNVTIDRITKIVRLINRKGAVPMQTFIDEFEVSKATIKRDFAFLKDRLNCPLDWDRSRRGWVIRSSSDDGNSHFELPGVWFNSSEVFALLTMLHLVEGVQPGLLEEHVGPLKVRLKALLAEGTQSTNPIERKLKLIHFAPRKVEARHFQLIAGALLDEKRLQLRYLNRDRREHTERTISPQQLVHYRENWILDAWCHTRNALRSFALEAVDTVSVVDKPALQVSREEMQKHFRSGYGIFAGQAAQRARLKFTPAKAQWVSKEVWHHDQSFEYLEDGSYLLEVPYSNDQELLMDLLRHSPEVEILHPPELRHRLHQVLGAAIAKNLPLTTE